MASTKDDFAKKFTDSVNRAKQAITQLNTELNESLELFEELAKVSAKSGIQAGTMAVPLTRAATPTNATNKKKSSTYSFDEKEVTKDTKELKKIFTEQLKSNFKAALENFKSGNHSLKDAFKTVTQGMLKPGANVAIAAVSDEVAKGLKGFTDILSEKMASGITWIGKYILRIPQTPPAAAATGNTATTATTGNATGTGANGNAAGTGTTTTGANGNATGAGTTPTNTITDEEKNAEAFKNAFGTGIRNGLIIALQNYFAGDHSLGNAFKIVMKNILQPVAQIAQEALTEQLKIGFKYFTDILGQLFKNITSGIGSAISSLFSSFTTVATGGYVIGPGTSTSDSIPARLSNGEYVINAASVQKYGVDYLHALNTGRLHAYQSGGLVSNVNIPTAPLIDENQRLPSSPIVSNPVIQQELIIDAGEVISQGINTLAGNRAFKTFIRANKQTMRQELGID